MQLWEGDECLEPSLAYKPRFLDSCFPNPGYNAYLANITPVGPGLCDTKQFLNWPGNLTGSTTASSSARPSQNPVPTTQPFQDDGGLSKAALIATIVAPILALLVIIGSILRWFHGYRDKRKARFDANVAGDTIALAEATNGTTTPHHLPIPAATEPEEPMDMSTEVQTPEAARGQRS